MIRSRRRSSSVLACFALSCLCLARVEAEEEDASDRARTFLVLRLTEALDLSDEEALEVRRIIRDSEERRGRLRGERERVEAELRKALERPQPDAATLDPLIIEANRLDEELALLPEKNYLALQRILTPEQRAKLVLFRREMRTDVRRALSARRGARPAPRR